MASGEIWKLENRKLSCFVAEALAHVRNLVHRAIDLICATQNAEKRQAA